jgi:dihydroorotate dehydrogenase electron transfer subunit
MQEHSATLLDHQRLGRWSRWTLSAPALANLQPGQYVALRCAPADSYDPLVREPLFVAGTDARAGTISWLVEQNNAAWAFLVSQPIGAALSVLGPLGHGWQIPPTARTVALVGTTTHAAALFGLAQHAVARGLAASLLLGAPAADAAPPPFLLPADAEYNLAIATDEGRATRDEQDTTSRAATVALEQLTADTLRWADVLAVALPFEILSTVAQRVRHHRLQWTDGMVQALVLPPPACHVGVCGVCTVPTRQGYRLACVDGPVFDLKQVTGNR